jgi:cytochrome P450
MLASGSRIFGELEARAAGAALEIDAHQEMVRLTLDVVTNALFGQLLHESAVPMDALTAALSIVSEGANGVPLPAWLPTPHNIKFRRTVRVLDELVYRIIRKARERHIDDGSLLSMLLATRDEQGAPLDDKAVRDEVLTMFIAGHETTALALTWLFALLDGAPGVLARMNQELLDVLGGREPSFADVPKLPYMRQVIDETLRLRPPGPYVPRNAVADDEIAGYRVHAGEMILMFIWATHRHPDFWTAPHVFTPERFDPATDRGRDSWSYLPFSAGPRTCIGNMFAILESTLLLAQMLTRFDITVRPCAHLQPVAIGTVRPSGPVRLILKPKIHVAADFS